MSKIIATVKLEWSLEWPGGEVSSPVSVLRLNGAKIACVTRRIAPVDLAESYENVLFVAGHKARRLSGSEADAKAEIKSAIESWLNGNSLALDPWHGPE